MVGGGEARRQVEGLVDMTRSRWNMQWLAYVLLILGIVGTLAKGLGDAPLLRFIPAISFPTLPLLCTLGGLGVLLRPPSRPEHAVTQPQEYRQELEPHCREAAG